MSQAKQHHLGLVAAADIDSVGEHPDNQWMYDIEWLLEQLAEADEPDIGTCTGCGADATGVAPLLCADCRSAASR